MINADNLNQMNGSRIYNFSYPGGTLIDMMETFWYVVEKQKLDEVYLGINFNLYNDFERNDNVKQAKSIMKNLFSYSFSKAVLKSMVQNIKKQYFVPDYVMGKPDMSKDEFWKYLLTTNGKRFYQKYKHPDQFLRQLSEISDYCKKNHIKLVFFIPPTHVELQQRIADFNLEKDNFIFIQEISKLGKCYNLDTSNEYTQNRKNFNDPFHMVNDSFIVHSIWIRH